MMLCCRGSVRKNPPPPAAGITPAPPEVEKRRTALWWIVHDMKPITVRKVFYQATVRGFVKIVRKYRYQITQAGIAALGGMTIGAK
jgi:hypothetical protein